MSFVASSLINLKLLALPLSFPLSVLDGSDALRIRLSCGLPCTYRCLAVGSLLNAMSAFVTVLLSRAGSGIAGFIPLRLDCALVLGQQRAKK